MNKTKATKTKAGSENNKWTVLIYMASDNTLSEESTWALTEMRSVELKAGVNVVTLFDSDARGVATKKFTFRPSETKQGASGNSTENRPLVLIGEDFFADGKQLKAAKSTSGATPKAQFEKIYSAADPRVLKKFLMDVGQDPKFKAPYNMLILSGHGSGTIGDFLTGNDPSLAMSIPRVGKVIKDVLQSKSRINILGMDSCLMSMLEICYELKDSVDFLIGAEGFEPETGWPYLLVLEAVNKAASSKSKNPVEELACEIAESYVRYYQDYAIAGVSVDQAVCDLRPASPPGKSKIDLLVATIKKLVNKLLKEINDARLQDLLVLAHWKAQSYKSEQYTDLWDFCELLRQSCKTDFSEIAEACKDVQELIKEGKFVLSSTYYGTDAQHSHGISLYFPWKDSAELDAYQKLPFSVATKWGKFLRAYVRATQRKVRGEEQFTRNADGEITDPSILELHITSAASPLLPSAESLGGIKNPPDTGKNPPDTGKNPPDTGKNKFALRSNMKNSPTSFLVQKDSGEAIQEE